MPKAKIKKDHILSEIKRTALKNGGSPLGAARFELETGIKTTDCLGVYWPRWSDALQEAGFEPNEMQSAYESGFLLSKLAELALEVGRIPVRNDLKLKRRSDPSFPSWNVFSRLGTKAEVTAQLAEYCKSCSEYAAVIAWCAQVPTAETVPEESTDNEELNFGDVYLFKSGRYYKIGKSNSAGRREYEIGIQLPERIVTIHVIRTDDPSGIEEYWHKRFASKRKNGEWFDLDPSDIAAFKRRKFM